MFVISKTDKKDLRKDKAEGLSKVPLLTHDLLHLNVCLNT